MLCKRVAMCWTSTR